MAAKSHRYSIKSVLNDVYLAKIDGKYWRNGCDGYFYFDEYKTEKLSLVEAYQKIQSGYSWNNKQICHRRYYHGRSQGLFSSVNKKAKITR